MEGMLIDKRKRSSFKYKWQLRKYWMKWLKNDIKRLYYSKIHGIDMDGFNGTTLPSTGKGKFVSVHNKGKVIQIKHEKGYEHLEYDEIRIVPCLENHGIMVERFKDGKLCNRNHLSIDQLNKSIIFAANVEQLSGQKQ